MKQFSLALVQFFVHVQLNVNSSISNNSVLHKYTVYGGGRGVMVIVAGYGHGDTSSNPGPNWLHFT